MKPDDESNTFGMIGFYFSPQLIKDTESHFLSCLAAFPFFFSYLMVSKIIKVEVVGYVFLGLCHLPCLTELEFYEDENSINCSKNPHCLTIAQGFCFYGGHIFVMNYLKSSFQLKRGEEGINWKKCYLPVFSFRRERRKLF